MLVCPVNTSKSVFGFPPKVLSWYRATSSAFSFSPRDTEDRDIVFRVQKADLLEPAEDSFAPVHVADPQADKGSLCRVATPRSAAAGPANDELCGEELDLAV